VRPCASYPCGAGCAHGVQAAAEFDLECVPSTGENVRLELDSAPSLDSGSLLSGLTATSTVATHVAACGIGAPA